jgi:hypothetical protein
MNHNIEFVLKCHRDSLRKNYMYLEQARYDLDVYESAQTSFRGRDKFYDFRHTNDYKKNIRWFKDEIEYNKTRINQILETILVIGQICLVKNLPAGDPCWMSRMISSYL